MTTKPVEVNRIWAISGTTIDPGQNKYSLGWEVEIPPHEYMNYVQNIITQTNAHNNEEGINKWDGTTQYPLAALAKDSDGFIYKANTANTNHQPSISNDWDKWGESKDAVPAGTAMVFYQALAPLGWIKDTTKDNHMLRVVSSAGGGSGGVDSPILNNKVAVHNHTASSNTTGAHAHTYTSWKAGTNHGLDNSPEASYGTYPTSSAGNHDHIITVNNNSGSNWTPKYVDMIICVFEGTE
ncbi:MAG: hypothetical protein DRH08_07855 [Deltaproteobacteria bacterium]|nr:MAG: hypothetical protein DRH08_07855 [Deltaproteobacteria bacterium]